MFTIEVKKRKEGEDYTFEDVMEEADIFHEDCGRGRVEWSNKYGNQGKLIFGDLRCRRCGRVRTPYGDEEAKLSVLKTVIDGEERRFAALEYTGDGSADDLEETIRVIQKV